MEDIASNLTIQYIRTCWNPTLGQGRHHVEGEVTPAQTLSELSGDPSGSYDEMNAMQLSASLNLFSQASVGKVTYDPETGRASEVSFDPSSNDKRWIIQTKFETPILNFKSSQMTFPTYGKDSIAKGMWHQYGSPPTEPDVGIFLQIEDVPRNWVLYSKTQNLTHSAKHRTAYDWNGSDKVTGSLANLVGFPQSKIRLGATAKRKTISEAVVAVPFIEKDGQRQFFNIDRGEIAAALQYLEGKTTTSTLPGSSIIDMVTKMSKYVFPPKMDFITNLEEVTPYAAYIFEFFHELNQADLADIWQNLPPDTATTIEKQTATISHKLLQNEILGAVDESTGETLPCNLQWMVFKVKRKAQWNYSDKIFGEAAAHGSVTKITGKLDVRAATIKKLERTRDTNDRFPTQQASPGSPGVIESGPSAADGFVSKSGTSSGKTPATTPDLSLGEEFQKSEQLGVASEKTTSIPDYNYNWPYDYFSLVELVKIDASVSWGSPPEKRTKNPRAAGATRVSGRTVLVEEGVTGDTIGDTRGKK